MTTVRNTRALQAPLARPLAGSNTQHTPLALVAWAALCIAVNVGLSRFTYGIMLPGLKRDLGLDYATAGLLHAAHLGGYMLGTLAVPLLGKRIDLRSVMRRAHWLVAFGAALSALAPAASPAGPYILGLGRFATGFGGAAAVVAVFVTTLAAIPARARPGVSASVWGSVGAVVVLTALAAPHLARSAGGDWRLVFWLTSILAMGLALHIPATVPSSVAAQPGAGTPEADAKGARWSFLSAGYLCFGIGYIGFATFLGSRLLDAQVRPGLLGITWAVFGFAMMAGAAAAVLMLRSPSLARYTLVAASAAGLVGAMVATSGSAGAAVAAAALVGSSVAATPAIITAYARQRCSGQAYARVFGYLTAVAGLGQWVGPALTGVLADRLGTQAVPVVTLALYAGATVCALLDSRFGTRPASVRGKVGEV